MLCRMAFHLSGKVVALHLNNNTFKALCYHESGQQLWYYSYSSTIHLSVEVDYLSEGKMVPKWHHLP